MTIGLVPVAIGSVGMTDAVALGGAVTFAALVSAVTAPIARRMVDRQHHRFVTVLLVAAAASLWSLGVRTVAPDIWDRLHVWLSLAGVNCMALAAAGASGDDEDLSRLPGRLVASALFLLAAIALGAARELLATGTIQPPFALTGSETSAGEGSRRLLFRIAALPAGGFLALGGGIALGRELKRRFRRIP
jgi:Na+-translocating ferredoxin:NAD+ oxidoreductase RnfE subunit